jgi:hypothetical protein
LQIYTEETATSGVDDCFSLDSGSAGLPAASVISAAYVSQISAVDGVLTATIGSNALKFIQGESLTLHPVTAKSSTAIGWNCSFFGQLE